MSKLLSNNKLTRALHAPSKLFKFFAESLSLFKKGGVRIKSALALSYIVSGAGQVACGQYIKGLLFAVTEVIYIVFMAAWGAGAARGFFTLDTQGVESQYCLVYGLVSFFLSGVALYCYAASIKSAAAGARDLADGKKPPSFVQELKALFHTRFYVTLLLLPVLGALAFTVVPLLFMVAIAFTNYGNGPGNIIPIMNERYLSWTGFQSFKSLFSVGDNLTTFLSVLGWTMLWAVLATFTCYTGGLFLAMLLGKKCVKGKAFWRTLFVIVMATPQFASLRIMYSMFDRRGFINTMLLQAGIITERFGFWENALAAKILIIVINMWVGIPYFMLLMSGLLANIPQDYYEYAKTEGASSSYIFKKITFPYIYYLTAPLIITSFVANINNFNVIYLLTGGGPMGGSISGVAGQTDILITWLYKLTMRYNPVYNLGAAVGLVMFIISVVLSLFIYRRTKSYKNEGDFA